VSTKPKRHADLATGWVGCTDDGGVLWHFYDGSPATTKTAEERHIASQNFGGGRPDIPVLVDATQMTGFSKEAREFSGAAMAGHTGPVAIIVGNPVIRVIVQVFVATQRPTFPIKAFSDPGAAMTWLHAPVVGGTPLQTNVPRVDQAPLTAAEISLPDWDPDRAIKQRTTWWCMGDDGIVRVVLPPVRETLEDAHERMATTRELSETHGKLKMLIEAGRAGWVSGDVRQHYNAHMPPHFEAVAVIVGNPVSKVVAGVFLRLMQTHFKIRVFDDPELGKQWLLSL